MIVLYLLFFKFKIMVTWWDWNTSFILALHFSCFIFVLIFSWILSSSQQSPIHHAGLHYLSLFYPILLLSILVNPLLTSNGSCTQDLIITVYPIHDFIKCVTRIFIIVTDDYVIRDSCFLDILPYSIHELPEFSLSDPSHMPR